LTAKLFPLNLNSLDRVESETLKELGEFQVDLDGRFSSIRTGETNLGNFVGKFYLTTNGLIFDAFKLIETKKLQISFLNFSSRRDGGRAQRRLCSAQLWDPQIRPGL